MTTLLKLEWTFPSYLVNLCLISNSPHTTEAPQHSKPKSTSHKNALPVLMSKRIKVTPTETSPSFPVPQVLQTGAGPSRNAPLSSTHSIRNSSIDTIFN